MTIEQLEKALEEYAQNHAGMGLRNGAVLLLQRAMVGRGEDMRGRKENQIRHRTYTAMRDMQGPSSPISFQVVLLAGMCQVIGSKLSKALYKRAHQLLCKVQHQGLPLACWIYWLT